MEEGVIQKIVFDPEVFAYACSSGKIRVVRAYLSLPDVDAKTLNKYHPWKESKYQPEIREELLKDLRIDTNDN